MRSYTPSDWYWQVAGGGLYSSRAAAYAQPDDATYLAWLARGNRATRIASEAELRAVLAAQHPAGLPADAAAQDARRGHELSRSDAVLFKVAFNHENRIRSLEGKQPVTAAQFRTAVKALL